ncbi:MAG: cob(I)yrinic acid a,c-diamide adenosyltransferase [Deltaproteobacteria bacterium]|nr:cob(I)yrinic acid a,c-diamide adenosyltransferase [Deltaproteobacteria bacterium]
MGDERRGAWRKRLAQGLVQVYIGDGKGKTTAALGLCFRAAGHGFKSYIIQFMKGQIVYGELESAKKLAPLITIVQKGRPDFVNKKDPDPVDVGMAQEAFAHAREVVMGGEYDVVVLDEINVAMDFGLVAEKDVLDLIRGKPPHVELVLTGRYAPEGVVAAADLVTEMKLVKHYYEHGVGSRDGIER